MNTDTELSAEILQQLERLYEEIMWLRARPNVTSSVARSWYTHACSERLKKHVRRFSGFVSEEALREGSSDLMLEHYLRMQTTLTQMVERHYQGKIDDPKEFVSLVCRCEEVHIVTRHENYAALKAKGDYQVAGIELRPWETLPYDRRLAFWKWMLKGRVSNHLRFHPGSLPDSALVTEVTNSP